LKYLIAVVFTALVTPVFADGEAEYKYREGVMKAIGGHMSSISAIMRGQTHTDNLAVHAQSIAALSEIAATVFPEGSDVAKSEALAAVWKNPAEFRQATEKFISAAKSFSEAAVSGENVGQALRGLGQSCKGCHDDFREEH
jgi:cytochrome c556